MECLWKYSPENKLLRLDIDLDLFYTSTDAGRTIYKYVKGQLVDTLLHERMTDEGKVDDWSEELKFLSQNYHDKVGKLYCPWYYGYLTKEGAIVDKGKQRGQGVVSPEKPISIDRLGVPANIMEWWDYTPYAFGPDIDDTSCGRGIVWYKHNTTRQIVRTSHSNCPLPNENFPIIHGPYDVYEDDIRKHNGIYFEEINNQGILI